MNEIIKDIPGTSGNYKISNLGKVYSNKSGELKELSQSINSKYLVVCLYYNNKNNIKYIHKLVAESFLGHNPNGYEMVINHIDGDTRNNNLSNLEIITQRENVMLRKDKLHSSSPYIGVSWCEPHHKWIARITINKKRIWLGYYDCDIDAYNIYIKATNNLDKYTNPKDFLKLIKLL